MQQQCNIPFSDSIPMIGDAVVAIAVALCEAVRHPGAGLHVFLYPQRSGTPLLYSAVPEARRVCVSHVLDLAWLLPCEFYNIHDTHVASYLRRVSVQPLAALCYA